MAIASKHISAGVNPAWLVRTATISFVGMCACVLLVKNILPHGHHEYGWPLVFSSEATPGPNGPPITYGPWPIYLPAPRTTSRLIFLADALFAEIFLALAAIVPQYWMRTCHVVLRYRLRSLLMFTFATACVLSIFKCESIAGDGWQIANFVYDTAIQLVLVSTPMGAILAATHWYVARYAVDGSRRRWLPTLLLTWLAVLATSGPLIHYMFFAGAVYRKPPLTLINLARPALAAYGYGWPLAYRIYSYDDGTYSAGLAAAEPHTSILSLTVDVAVWLLIAFSVGLSVASWTRQIAAGKAARAGPIVCFLLAVALASGIMQCEQSPRPQWFHNCSLFFGSAAVTFTIMLPIACHWAAFPKLCVSVWAYVSLMVWLGAPPEIVAALVHSEELRMCAAAAFVAGAVAASVCDAFYRLAVPYREIPEQLFRANLGEHLFIVPMWLVGILGISGGIALICR